MQNILWFKVINHLLSHGHSMHGCAVLGYLPQWHFWNIFLIELSKQKTKTKQNPNWTKPYPLVLESSCGSCSDSLACCLLRRKSNKVTMFFLPSPATLQTQANPDVAPVSFLSYPLLWTCKRWMRMDAWTSALTFVVLSPADTCIWQP